MNLFDLDPSNPAPKPEPRLQTRHLPSNEGVHDETTQNRSSYPEESSLPPTSRDDPESWPRQTSRAPSHRLLRNSLLTFAALALIGVAAFFFARHWIRSATYTSLPQLDGSLSLSGLTAPVTIQRDVHGVPHIHAADLDDLVFAQGFVTAGDRLFQMDLLRRHAAGELAEILGATVVPHDRLQRTLQIRAAADRAVAALPLDQLHLLQSYARGVNASIERQAAHLPVEFRVLRYQPAPWSPRDSLLVSLAMFEDLTNTFSSKLARESLIASLRSDPTPQTGIQTGIQTGPELIPELIQDLYPVGSWRDHPPTSPEPDLTVPGPPIEQVPLDESQSSQTSPGSSFLPQIPTPSSILASLQPLLGHTCLDCNPGSNNWVVSGTHTASGKPLLSNDMHLNHTLPGIWYEADLKIDAATSPGTPEPLRVAGLSLPGLPLIVVGHNAHIAWASPTSARTSRTSTSKPSAAPPPGRSSTPSTAPGSPSSTSPRSSKSMVDAM